MYCMGTRCERGCKGRRIYTRVSTILVIGIPDKVTCCFRAQRYFVPPLRVLVELLWGNRIVNRGFETTLIELEETYAKEVV